MQKSKRLLTFAAGTLVAIASGCTTTSIKDSTFYKDFAVQKELNTSRKFPEHSHKPMHYKHPAPQKSPCPEKVQCPPIAKRGLYTEPWTHKTPQPQKVTTLSGSEPRKISEKNIRYNLEKIVLHGREYHVENNSLKEENELDFILKKVELGTELRRSPYGQPCGTSEVISEKIYIPTLVKNKEGKRLIGSSLKTKGKFGVTAQTTKYDLENVQVGVIYETNQDTRFNLLTAFMNGKEYFVPAVDDTDRFYIIPLKTTQIGTEEFSGRIRLTNKTDGFFELKEIPTKQYNAREKEKTKKIGGDAGRLDKSTEFYSSTQPAVQPH